MVKIGGRMVGVLDATLQTIRLDSIAGGRPGGHVLVTLYPVGEDGRIQTEAGVEALASVVDQKDGATRLSFKISTYPLSKLIIRSLARRQGIEPYHSRIGL